ncbi:MAG: FmdB family zinc ribbon protein [Gammaproteobacteria bacterium]
MPIYAYQCAACGHRFDELQKLADVPLTVCPECGDASLQKLMSAPNLNLNRAARRRADENRKPRKRPKYMHMFDSPVPHGDHHAESSHAHGHDHVHGRDHSHDD